MTCEVEYSNDFAVWWDRLTDPEQQSVAYTIKLLVDQGVQLKRPFADTIRGSVFRNLRELRCQHEGRPFRVLYAFDPRRTALLLIGGDKTGNNRWYDEFIPRAEKIYADHLKEIGYE